MLRALVILTLLGPASPALPAETFLLHEGEGRSFSVSLRPSEANHAVHLTGTGISASSTLSCEVGTTVLAISDVVDAPGGLDGTISLAHLTILASVPKVACTVDGARFEVGPSKQKDALRSALVPLNREATKKREAEEVARKEAAALEPFDFTEVVQVEGRKAGELYSAALAWASSTYVSGKAATDLADAAGGRLILKVLRPFEVKDGLFKTDGKLHYVVTIETRDGRYRVSVGSFELDGLINRQHGTYAPLGPLTVGPYPGKGLDMYGHKLVWKHGQEEARTLRTELLASLKSAMSKAVEEW